MGIYFHGSSSASLVGVLDRESPGLKSTGQLIEEERVPYCGELYQGIAKNAVNRKCISVVPAGTVNVAIDSALRYLKEPWSPKYGKRYLKLARRELNRSRSERDIPDYLREHNVGILELRIRIEELRLRNWENLSEAQRDFVTNPFPVIYAVKYDGQVVPVNSQYGREVGIPEKVSLEDLTVFAPKSKIGLVREMAKDVGDKPVVLPLFLLNPMKAISVQVRKSIEYFLTKDK